MKKYIFILFILLARFSFAQMATKLFQFEPTGNLIENIKSGVKLNNIVIFAANDGIFGRELWRTDGTVAGTFILKDINIGTRTASSNPFGFYNYKGMVYFFARDNTGKFFLFKTDGTKEGTLKIDVDAFDSAFSLNFIEFKNSLYILREKAKLWKTDGTKEGTQKVLDFPQFVEGFTIMNNILYAKLVSSNNELIYKTDGTQAGTTEIKRFPRAERLNSTIVSMNNNIYFAADDGNYGSELWKSDGTPEGTKMLIDIAKGGKNSFPFDLTPIGNLLIFQAQDQVDINGLVWKTDGTESGTIKLKNTKGENLRKFTNIIKLNDALVFSSGISEGASLFLQTYKDDGMYLFDIKKNESEMILPNVFISNDAVLIENNKFYYLDSNRDLSIFDLTDKKNTAISNPSISANGFQLLENLWIGSVINYVSLTEPYMTLYSIPLCKHTAKINSPNGTSFCTGGSVSISAEASGTTNPYTFKWKQGTSDLGTASNLSVTKSGNYTVEVTDKTGCTVSSSIDITQVTNLPVTVSGNNSICSGQSTNLTATVSGGVSPFTYQWKNSSSNVGANTSTFSANAEGLYNVSITDSKGCTGTSSNYLVTQKPSPDVTITKNASTDILTGGNVILSVPSATNQSYQWLKNSFAINGATNNSYTASEAGKFSVTVNRNGCIATSEAISVNIILANELPNPNEFKVFPNPVENSIKVNFLETIQKTAKLHLISSSGTIIKKWTVNQQENILNVSEVPNGIYLLQVEFNGKNVIQKLFKNN